MILRRLSQSLKEQNWTAIWIEFILLVSGVFLGIQVANWNESRKESIQELADLKNLAQDIRSDILEIDETIAISTWRMSVLEALVFNATGERLPESFTLPFGVVQVGCVIVPTVGAVAFGTALITTFADATEVHPVAVTVTV